MTHKILVIAPNWVGDAIMAHSLYQLLKKNHPDRCIDVIAPAAFEPLHALMPEIRRFIATPMEHGKLPLAALWSLAQTLRQEQYQEAYVLPNSLKSALLPWLSGIPRRVGYHGEMRYGLLNYRHQLDKKALPTMTQRFNALAFARHTDPESIPIPYPALQATMSKGQALATTLGLDTKRPVLILCPGAAYGPAKRWPVGHFKAIAESWASHHGPVWVMGDKKDKTHADAIANANDAIHSLAGRTSLADACELMALGRIVVSNDSGLMHLAAALQRPLVAIYGSSSPGFTPPLAHDIRMVMPNIACSPCFERTCRFGHYRCLTESTPQQVTSQIHTLLEATA